MNRGILVIALILLMGIIGGSAAVWFHHSRQHRALDFWGIDAATIIRHAEKVEVSKQKKLAKDDPQTNVIHLNGARYWPVETKEITTLPGLLHARHALIEDASFDWQPDPTNCKPKWEYAITFRRNRLLVTILIDFNCRLIWCHRNKKTVRLDERILNGFKQFTVDVFSYDSDEQN